MPRPDPGHRPVARKRGSARSSSTGNGVFEMESRMGPKSTLSTTSESDPLLAPNSASAAPARRYSQQQNRIRQSRRISEVPKKSVLKRVLSKGVFKKSFASPRRSVLGPTPEERSSGSSKHAHSFLYSMLNPNSHSTQAMVFKRFIGLVILGDLILFIISTDPAIAVPGPVYFGAEGAVSCVFLLEYILRLTTIAESRKYSHPFWGRLAYVQTWSAIVDIMSTLPWFLEQLSGFELPTLTYLRFFRLMRILKTEHYARAFDSVYRVIYFNSAILYVASLVCMYLVLFTAVLLYYLRPPDVDENPQFRSILSTIYLSALILMGQGGPDETNLPWYTRAIVLLTSLFSIPMFAVPSSMLTWGFEAEAERLAKHSRKQVLKKREQEERSRSASTNEQDGTCASSSSSSSSDLSTHGNTTDEEYFRLIAGEDDDGSSEEDSFRREVRETFKAADANRDGSISLQEFVRLNGQQNAESFAAPADQFETRIQKLEESAASNTTKLDRILALLEKQGTR